MVYFVRGAVWRCAHVRCVQCWSEEGGWCVCVDTVGPVMHLQATLEFEN